MDKTTLIIGNGACARRIAEHLLSQGIDVVLVTEDPSYEYKPPSGVTDQYPGSLEVLTATEVLTCHGLVGQFEVLLLRSGSKIHRSAAIIIIAVDYELQSNAALYGLKPGNYVWPLSQLNHIVLEPQQRNRQDLSGKQVVFLTGLLQESNPVVQKNIMLTALKLQSKAKAQTYMFTRNLNVSANGLETLSHELKRAGGVITKFNSTLPRIQQHTNGRVALEYLDEVSLDNFRLNPDLTVVDETICPSRYLGRLSTVLGLDTDQTGFLQTDNPHRIPVYTNRVGILAAGPSRSVQVNADNMVDADAAALSALEMLAGCFPKTPPSAEINSNRCVRCLTCLRLCPHHAISFDKKLWIGKEACQGCGLCVAECPAVAIVQNKLHDDLITRLQLNLPKEGELAGSSYVAFCCSRSAARAADLASCMGYELPTGLIIVEVPCASSISMGYILAAFASRAAGVLVFTCHDGNCFSEKGTAFARNRVNQIMHFLKHSDASQGRIELHTLAANMGKEFYDIVNRWDRQLTDMGPMHT